MLWGYVSFFFLGGGVHIPSLGWNPAHMHWCNTALPTAIHAVVELTSIIFITECRPGYYKLHEGCVSTCPEHYYGTMETIPVPRMVPLNTSRPSKRQGVCHPCNEACQTCRGPHVVDCFQCNDEYEIRDEYCRKKLLLNFLDPDMLGFFVWVIVLCISAILLFGVVFGILQARDHHLLCWKEKRHFNEGKGKYNGIALSYIPETLASDRQHLNVIQNMNFNHGHFRETFDKL